MSLCHVTNTLTTGVTTFENYDFNSYIELDGKYYGFNANGMFELESADKDTVDTTLTDINASMTTALLHFGSEMQKRMSDFYIAMRSEGDIALTVNIDEQDSYDYLFSPLDIAEINQRRSLIGKGARGKYWQFVLANTAGADFDYDTMNLGAVVTDRRI